MKDFKKFLEEISIKDNPGIPGEGERRDDDKDYLRDLEREELNRLRVNKDDMRELPRVGGELGRISMQLNSISRGKERELEELATQVILSEYGDILDGVELDIKIGNPAEVLGDKDDESESENEMPSFKDVVDPDLLDKIHKGKLSNNIIQGEAKNTKRLFHSEMVREGMIRIFGEAQAENVIRLLEELTTLADKLDWVFPLNLKGNAMEQDKDSGANFAGAVKVEWKPKEIKADDNTEVEEEPKTEEEETPYDEFTPVIRARGIDFAMLLHETVKGIFELIGSVAAPEMGADPKEVEDFETVKVNISSMLDEAEEFRTGPRIAADFRDFIDNRPEAHKVNNIRAFIFGKMCDNNYMTPKEFLELFRGILNNTEEAQRKVDRIIKDIVKEFEEYENDSEEDNDHLFNQEEDHDDSDDDGQVDIPEVEKSISEEPSDEVDYSTMKARDLQELIDDAIDAGNYELLATLTQYMKNEDMRLIYTNELKLINENLNPHNKK